MFDYLWSNLLHFWSWCHFILRCLRLGLALSKNSFMLSQSLFEIECIIFLSILANNSNFALLLKKVAHSSFLFTDKWQGLDFSLPFFCNHDSLFFYSFCCLSVSLLICIANHFFYIFGILGVPDVVHV